MNISAGIAIASVAGVMNGIFPLPMKANKIWAWENNWLPFSFLSLVVFPAALACCVVPQLTAAFQHASTADLLATAASGVLVYTGSLLFGISLIYAGLTLSFALLVGSMNVVGILAPRLLLTHSLVQSGRDWLVLAGVALSTLSVLAGFHASRLRQEASRDQGHAPSDRVLGSILATLAGVLSGFLPVAITMPWAQRLFNIAVHQGGASPAGASNGVLSLILLGGAIPNCSYCIYLLWTRHSWCHYLTEGRPSCWGIVFAMAALYSASLALWGVAVSSSMLGPLGSSVGWALFVGMIVVSSTATGLLEGEWHGAGIRARSMLAGSLGCLLASMVIICLGNYFH